MVEQHIAFTARRIHCSWYRNSTPDEESARWLARRLIVELQSASSFENEAVQVRPERLQHLLGNIRSRPDLPWQTIEMANVCCCSPSTLQKHLGDTPRNFIQKIRMDRAADLLVNTSIPVGEISMNVGIADPCYFSKLFRKFRGSTPTDFRKGN